MIFGVIVTDINVKSFNELTVDELYGILKLRVDVFVVEQACAYQDLDGLDQAAIHVFIKENDEVTACLRVLPRGAVNENVAIGRVIAKNRRQGVGTAILKAGMQAAKDYFNAEKIYVGAQVYARGLYEKQGFVQVTDEFLEDDIPHIGMICEL